MYEAYQARFAAMPAGGRADGPLYYSYEVGPAHVIVLASFFVYSEGSAQYTWLQADLAKVDRAKTPWLLVLIHAPWYNSNANHQGAPHASAPARALLVKLLASTHLAAPPLLAQAMASSCASRSSRCCTRPR